MINVMIVVMLLVALLILGCGIYVVVAALKEIREIKKILKKDPPIEKAFQGYKFKDRGFYKEVKEPTFEEIFGYTE